jgi:hypothetical protein
MNAATITDVQARVYTIPLPHTESDGTLAWNAITVVTVLVEAGGRTGLGWR